MYLVHHRFVFAQRQRGVRRAVLTHLLGRALSHQQAACFTTFRAQINDPVSRANHVQVVLDDDERMARFQQLAQRAHQLGNVVKVQTCRWLVK